MKISEMSILTAFVLSLLLHIVTDFHFQGILGSMKQKDWWKRELSKPENKNFNEHPSKYKYDYLAALYIHSIEWAIIVSIPYLIASGHPLQMSAGQVILIAIHAFLHASMDDSKCNDGDRNLVEDQLFHLVQIASLVFVVGL